MCVRVCVLWRVVCSCVCVCCARACACVRVCVRVICAYPIGLSCMRVLCRQVQSCCRCAAKPVPDRFSGSLCRIALHSLDLRSLYASMYRALVAASAFGRERALSASPQADVMPHRSTLGRLAACAF